MGRTKLKGPGRALFRGSVSASWARRRRERSGGLLLGAHVRGTCEKMKMGRLGHGYRKPGAGPILLLLCRPISLYMGDLVD